MMKNVQYLIIAGFALATFAGNVAHAAPVAEADVNATTATKWGWYYNLPLSEINQKGDSTKMRPFKLVPNGIVEATPRFHVLFVSNSGDYKVKDWQIVTKAADKVSDLSLPSFRIPGWRVINTAWHTFKPNGSKNAISQMTAIAVSDPLYFDYEVRPSLTRKELEALDNQGYRVVDFENITEGANARYAAVIAPNKGKNQKTWAWLFNQSRGEILKTAKELNGKAYRVSDIERLSNGNFNALLVASGSELSNWYTNLTTETLKTDALRRHGSWTDKINDGIRFTNIAVYKDSGNVTKIDVITMENGIGTYPISRDPIAKFEAIDKAVIKAMSRRGTPGTSLALSKNGKTVYRAAYGYSDLNNATPATRSTNGRIASITKTFTAAAIMKLAQQGLDLDKPVFGPNGYLKDLKPYDYKGYTGTDVPNLNTITVRHLLTHTAGWDRGLSGDPSLTAKQKSEVTCDGNNECEPTITGVQYIATRAKLQGLMKAEETRGANATEVIQWMMKPDDADYLPAWKPGEKQVYSNFGYTVLEKIIEVRSNMSYVNYIKQMAKTMGVDFYDGASDPALPVANEWKYYSSPGDNNISNVFWNSAKLTTSVPPPYIYDMNSMRAHGGWVTSPSDLVKFMDKMTGAASSPWISQNEFLTMIQRPAPFDADATSFYGLSWGINTKDGDTRSKFIFGHGGRLTGSAGVYTRGWFHRKVSLAVLFNSTADAAGSEIKASVEPIMESMDDKNQLTGFNFG